MHRKASIPRHLKLVKVAVLVVGVAVLVATFPPARAVAFWVALKALGAAAEALARKWVDPARPTRKRDED